MLLALIGTVSLVGYVQSAKDEAVAQESPRRRLRGRRVRAQGRRPRHHQVVGLDRAGPARLKQAGAITDLEAIGDQVAATDLQPGDQLLAARLAQGEVTEEVTDKVQISALLEAERAVGGALKKGDLVGVYLSFDPFDLDEAGQTVETPRPGRPDRRQRRRAAGAGRHAHDESKRSTGDGEDVPNMTRLEFQNVLVTNVQTTNAP
jgi:hypothetical protein